jgi:tripartite-type tricarboxylate transporter receptor subunit TctC
MRSLHRRALLLAAGASTLAAPSRVAWAQAYPSRPVHLVEGYGAGSAPDIIARLIGQWLAERLGRPFVVDNKPGASGRIASDSVAKATPDGYTLLLVLNNNAVDAAIKHRLSFDFIRDIAPVAGIYRLPLVMEVHPSVPATTVAEFIALAKERPGKINMASAGTGTGTHLAGELFQIRAGISLFHVPYRGVQALRDLLAGEVQVYFGPVASSLAHIKAGKLRPLAVTTATRSHVLPDVPALGETLPGYEFSAWYGLGAPRGTSAEVIAMLNKAVNSALDDPAFKAQLADLGGTPLAGSPEAFGSLIVADSEKMSNVIRVANITVE